MKYILLIVIITAAACSNDGDHEAADTAAAEVPKTIDTSNPVFDPHIHGKDTVDLYSNETFKNVRVEKTGETTYTVTGQARVFEAVYHYLVKDGNEVVTDGHGMTDAGAPAFGHFSFSVDVKKKTATEGLYLILFEVSRKDGSRQHELPIPLSPVVDK